MSSQDEVEEFAALLRHLKGRTDRSYAALARRLNMNASTLHRYCAGEAVPLGFASVEKFAALCGASPAERVELHRLWILAAAARQRPRTAPGSETGSDTAEALASEAGQSTEDAAAPPPPGAALAPAPGEHPDVTESGEALERDRHPGPGGAAESLPGSSPERADGARTPWYRRRVAVAAAVVTALLATLGSLSALPSGHSSADAADRTSDAPAAKATGVHRGSATPSAPPSTRPGRPSGTPSPSTSGKRGTSPSPSTSPSSPTAGSAVTPLTWTANSHRWATGCFHDYVIDKAPEQVPPPPAPQDASPWARTQNAVHGGQMFVDITVQGRTDAAVVLEALRVRVVGRSAPVKGSVYSTGQGCGSDMAPHSFTVDLDKDRPIARAVPGNDSGTITPPMSMPYRVSVTDPEVLMVDARTGGCDCRWYLELDWSSQGRTGTERIDDGGRPFRTSGTDGLPRYWYAHDGWTLA
ncbi:helix-turn-helix domain-containing protein [Streptomyces sp. NPDC021080]|uniref:helix-turn-helix domain-containing protein n=1 Tax=Streptomyces sp. NPDC021080 TaxID=3365110 RepID=UPI0037875407